MTIPDSKSSYAEARDEGAKGYFATLKAFHGHIPPDLLVAYIGGWDACARWMLERLRFNECDFDIDAEPNLYIVGAAAQAANAKLDALKCEAGLMPKEMENGK